MSSTSEPAPDRRDFTQGPVFGPLLVFTLPLLGSSLLQSLNGTINAVWVGRYLGPSAMAAASNGNQLLFLLLGAVFGVATAASIFVGQALGAKDIGRARRVVGTGATAFIGLSVLVAAICFVLTPVMLRAIGTPADTLGMASAYLRVSFVSLPFGYLFLFVVMMTRASGAARTPFIYMSVSVVLDIVLNPLLIFGAGPLPGFGVAGSAASTVIAQAVSLVGLLAHLYRAKHPLILRGSDLLLLRPDPALALALVRKGVPMGLQTIVVSSSAVAVLSLVNRFGSEATAGYGAATLVWNFVQMPAMAISVALSTAAAQNIGAGRWDRVMQSTWAALGLQAIATGSLILLACLFDDLLLGLYTRDPQALEISKHANLIVCWGFWGLGASFVLFGAMRSAGDVMIALIVSLLSLWIVRLPFAALLTPRFGAEAIWWSYPLGTTIAFLLTAIYFATGRWKRARLGA